MLTTRWPVMMPGDDVRRRHRLRGKALQDAWIHFLGPLPWQSFVTLTFDPKRVYPVNCAKAGREAFTWCNLAARTLRCPLGWVYAPERSRSGQWHVHALIMGTSPESLTVPAAIWRLRNGFTDVQPVTGRRRITLYTTKAAALTGEVVWSDTLGRYRHALRDEVTVSLHP